MATGYSQNWRKPEGKVGREIRKMVSDFKEGRNNNFDKKEYKMINFVIFVIFFLYKFRKHQLPNIKSV